MVRRTNDFAALLCECHFSANGEHSTVSDSCHGAVSVFGLMLLPQIVLQ